MLVRSMDVRVRLSSAVKRVASHDAEPGGRLVDVPSLYIISTGTVH